MATPQQTKLIKLVLENMGSKRNKKTLGQLLLDAGYSKSISENPYLIFDSETIKEGLEPILNSLIKQRQNAIARLSKTISKAKYRDLVDAIDKLTKNIQLLSDEPTENIKSILSKEQIDELFSRRAKENNTGRDL